MSKKRQYRRLVSGILIALMACNIGLMISVAVFRYGIFDQAVLMNSFEKSGYFEETFHKTQSEIVEVLEDMGLPDEVFLFNDVKMSFERRMRSQVLNRSDAAAELNSISLVNAILDYIEKQNIETTLKSEEGIIFLSQELSQILLKKSEVAGIEQWHENAKFFSEKIPVFMIINGSLAVAGIAAMGVLQNKKNKFFVNIAAGLSGGSLLGVILSVILFMATQTGKDSLLNQVMAVYRQEILFVGLKISAAVFVIAAILDILGLAIKKMQ